MKAIFSLITLIAFNCIAMDGAHPDLVQTLFSTIVHYKHAETATIIECPQLVDTYAQYHDPGFFCATVTPIHVASLKGNSKALSMLLAVSKKSVNSPDKGFLGNTPLHIACNESVAEILLQNGAEVEHKNKIEETPLYRALFHPVEPIFDVARCLIKYGADINQRIDSWGDTLLHKAVDKNRNDAVAVFLLKHGADQSVVNNEGETPRDRAIFYGRKVELFK